MRALRNYWYCHIDANRYARILFDGKGIEITELKASSTEIMQAYIDRRPGPDGFVPFTITLGGEPDANDRAD